MIWSEQIIHFLTLLGGFRVTGIFSAGKSPRLLEAKKGPVRSCDVRWRSSKELHSPPPLLQPLHLLHSILLRWRHRPLCFLPLLLPVLPSLLQQAPFLWRTRGGSLVCTWGSEVKVIHFSALWFNRWWVWILWSHSGRAHSGRKRALVARDQWSSLRLSFGPYAPNGWCNEVCKTSLSLHVFGLVPVIGCVKKVWVMTRMRQ